MKYYSMNYDMDRYERNGVMAYHGELYGVGQYDVGMGKSITNWDERITFELKDGNEMADYIWNNLGWLIVSNKFKEAIAGAKMAGIQFLPVVINDINGESLKDYYVVNITNLVDAIDMDRSECFKIMDDLYSFISVVLKKNEIEGFDIFRVMGNEISEFVSENFVKIIKENKLAGFAFREIKVI
ncbi:imm11 family protein [Clostridium sp. YIM B02551]|uniref:imm11 family protein n=1 Tax=Clostridium sp. YIM B02551 TaxID=2910679 RepID=UPI001EEC61A0|nr:DUF1629 domain-containing protein [Clostridium sp. YIM B02551]